MPARFWQGMTSVQTQGRVQKNNNFVFKDAYDKWRAIQGFKLPPCLRASGILHALYSLTEIFSRNIVKIKRRWQCMKSQERRISNYILWGILSSVLTDAEAKTAKARLSSQSCSCFSRVLSLICSCASLAVGTVISFNATSSWLALDSFILRSSSSSRSSSSFNIRDYNQ